MSEQIDPHAAETLAGDIRDTLLTHIRSMETPWSKLSEAEQQDRIYAAQSAAFDLIRRTVQIVAHAGFPHVTVSTGKFVVKDGIKLELSAAGTVDNVTKLAEHGQAGAILVLAEASAFFGERQPAKADPDQGGMPFDEPDPELLGDEPAPSTAASDDYPEIPEHLDRRPKKAATREPAEA